MKQTSRLVDEVKTYQCKCPKVDAETGLCNVDCINLHKSCLCSECPYSEELNHDICR